MAEVLFVSKPVAPPWNDSSKNLVRDVSGHLVRHDPVVMGRRGQTSPVARGRVVDVYSSRDEHGFAPRLGERARVMRQLLLGRAGDLWHFFFAPNRLSSIAGGLARRFRPVPTIHTACSMPLESGDLRHAVFADVTVALSRASFGRFVAAGIPERALRQIPPSVPDLGAKSEEERAALRRRHGLPESATIWVYPGDLELGGGAEIALGGFAAWGRPDSLLLMACRDKTARAAATRTRLRDAARRWGIGDRVRWCGETPDIHELLALGDFVTMVNPSPFGKMDYPLAALEAMSLGRPVLVCRATPSAELAETGAAAEVAPSGEALASEIEHLSADATALRALALRGREYVTEELSPSKVAAAYETLYDELHA